MRIDDGLLVTTGVPIDAGIEPVREVLRRMHLHGFSISIRDNEARIIEAADKLARDGWLIDCGEERNFGATYKQFKPAPRLDMAALRDI